MHAVTSDNPGSDPRWSRWLGRAAGVLLLAWLVVPIVDQPGYGWDFRTYYLAGKLHRAGISPYDPAKIQALSEEKTQPYVYPPTTLPLWAQVSRLPYRTAWMGFLGLKVILIVGLAGLWGIWFLRARGELWLYPFCLLAFRSPMLVDLKTGNISTLEQAFLWGAFYCWARGWMVVFAGLILAVSSFKLVPLMFLGLLLLPVEGRRRWGLFAGALAIFLVCQLVLPTLLWPELLEQFRAGLAPLTGTRPPVAQSSLAFMLSLFERLDPGSYQVPGWATWGLFVATVLALTIPAIHQLAARDRRRAAIALACLAYAILLPRMVDYSYILVLAPAFFVAHRQQLIRPYPILLVIVALFGYRPGLIGDEHPWLQLVWWSGGFLATLGLWLLAWREARRGRLS